VPANLITVERFRDLPEALLAKGKLESAGIPCFLADTELVRTDWLLSNLIGNMRLQVRAEDAEEAVALLHEPIPATFITDDFGGAYDQPQCPKCNSLDIAFEVIDRFWSYALMLLGIPIPVRKSNWKCYSCGAEWIEQPPNSSEDSSERFAELPE
jgi:Putative prokaryotic signal transducing protein